MAGPWDDLAARVRAAHKVGLRRLQRGAPDRYNRPTETYAPAVERPVFAIYPATPDVAESLPAGGAMTRDFDVLAPSWDGAPRDHAVFLGREWEQVGEPEPFDLGPFGFAPGVRVSFKRWEETS